MPHTKKYTLRRIVSKLLAIYETILLVKTETRRYRKFVELLREAFGEVFTNVNFEERKIKPTSRTHVDVVYVCSFSLPQDVTDSNGARVVLSRVLFITYENFKSCMSLLQGLKRHINLDKGMAFIVSEKIDTRSTKYGQNPCIITTSESYIISAINEHCPEETESGFFDDLITAGLIDVEDDYSTVRDFFLDSWQRLSDFVRSALINFHVSYGDFCSIHICRACGKIFLPDRSGEERGVFCSNKCQKIYYKKDNKPMTNCIQNQKRRLDTLTGFWDNSEKKKLNLSKIRVPSIGSDCRNCSEIKKAAESGKKVKAGMCPVFLSNDYFLGLTKAYLTKKEDEKRNKPKFQKTSGFEGDYDVSNAIKF